VDIDNQWLFLTITHFYFTLYICVALIIIIISCNLLFYLWNIPGVAVAIDLN
jgi:hypothetical protein